MTNMKLFKYLSLFVLSFICFFSCSYATVLPSFNPSWFTVTSSTSLNWSVSEWGLNLIAVWDSQIRDRYWRTCTTLKLSSNWWYNCWGSNGSSFWWVTLSPWEYILSCDWITDCSSSATLIWHSFVSSKSVFSSVIWNLWLTISEFIPYVVYIWLWVLGVLIWFVAIKWFINWIRRKILSPFK